MKITSNAWSSKPKDFLPADWPEGMLLTKETCDNKTSAETGERKTGFQAFANKFRPSVTRKRTSGLAWRFLV